MRTTCREGDGALSLNWHSYTKADLCPDVIGDGPRVPDHVRFVGYSDRSHGTLASVFNLRLAALSLVR